MEHKRNFSQRLRWLWLAAILIGAVCFLLGLLWTNSTNGPGLDWIWGIAAFGLGVIIYNIAFFVFCSIFAPGLAGLVEDKTEVRGDTVVHVVEHAEVGDESIDFYIRAYASARATTATSIVLGILVTIALMFF